MVNITTVAITIMATMTNRGLDRIDGNKACSRATDDL